MPFIGTAAPFSSTENYPGVLRKLTGDGWAVVSEGPSGAQLRGPKKMKALDVAAMVLGVTLAFIFPVVGFILIGAAVLDYVFLTPRREFFLSRDKPREP